MACVACLLSLNAYAGNISFQLALTGSTLTLTSRGDNTAYYPAVFRLLADGHWQRLAAVSAATPAAELLPGGQLDLQWPESRPLQDLPPIERLQPLLVRFFDQAGVSFGQLSFLRPPPAAAEIVQAGYAGGMLTIAPPADGGIHASWILWAQEEGIEPIRKAVSFEHSQPPARRVEWHAGMGSLRLPTGAAQPAAALLHETPQGLVLQNVTRGQVQGRQQRTAWLDARQPFYVLALLAAVLAILLPQVGTWRRRASR